MKKPTVLFFTAALLFVAAHASASLINNLWVESGKGYVISSHDVGSTYYIDREYTVQSLLPPYGSATFYTIKTANDDRFYDSAEFLRFTLTESAMVYVAYDPRAASLPYWLADWELNQTKLYVSDPRMEYFDVYQRHFEEGVITLGGNWAEGSSRAHYANYIVLAHQNPIPEPSVMLLIGSGLVGLAVFRRKFRR